MWVCVCNHQNEDIENVKITITKMATIEKPKAKKKKTVKKSELQRLTDTNVDNSCSSSETNTKQVSVNVNAHETKDNIDDNTKSDDVPHEENKTVARTAGNAESISISSVEFVDIVSEYANNLSQVKICDSESREHNEHTMQNEELEEIASETEIEIASEIQTEIEIEIPSAPEESLTTIKNVCYPKLIGVDAFEEELSAPPVEIENVAQLLKCKPFNAEQLKELYCNPEIPMAELFENEFINAELQSNHRDHTLYDLLMKYSKSRYNLMINRVDMENIKKSIPDDTATFWNIESRNVKYSGKCMDGTVVNGSEFHNFAVLDEPLVDKVQSLLTDSTNLICTSSFSMYNSEIWRIEIERKIDELITFRPEFTSFSPNERVTLNSSIKDDLFAAIAEIRLSISILFCFTRRSQPDKTFANEIRNWLTKLVAVLLRLATWQDHLFILYHILRCPAGVASWASSFIQIPIPNADPSRSIFNNDEVHHCMALIRTLLLPIKTRNEFLVQLKDDSKVLDGVKDDLWVLVDSDGDEENTATGDCIGLKENDLISFLNQLPFEELFAQMTLAIRRYDKYSIMEDSVTGHHLLKFIAFATNLVQLLGEGLKTYDTERFKQFSKILSLLVRHTVLYVSNVNQIFKNNSTSKDPQLCLRIQIEYDAFVLRAIHHIYKSQSLGAWQYLAILPFSDLCSQTIWKLYYALIVGFTEDVIENIEDDFRRKVLQSERANMFNDSLVDVPSDDLYYLLQTFSSMALSRDLKEWDFVVRVSIDIFQIGFVNASTKELCYKISRDLIVNITTLHPYLISSILAEIKENYETVDNAVYLFKSLPLDKWKPSMIDFEYVASLILNNNFDTPKSLLARTIFSRLNWGFDDAQQLYLPHDIHIRVACLIAEVSSKHVPEVVGSSGISESVRNVSNLVKGQTTRQQFTTWCWNMIALLRLHCMDQSNVSVIQTLHNPSDIMKHIPELEQIQSIHQGVSDSRPIALYLSLLCSVWGHSVPQICHKGFMQMQALLSDYRHSTVIRCVQLVVPLFLECPESLSNCDKFQTILSQLLAADKTYMKMAKDLITSDYVGPVVELFGNMIQCQIINYVNYGLRSPVLLVNLWLQCLTVNSNWFKDVNAVHLIDLILRIAYQFQDAWYSAKEFFRFMYMNSDDTNAGKQSSFLTFLISSPVGPFPSPTPNALWLALLTLEVEHEVLEIQTKLWPELLRQLQETTDKFSIDVVIKKSANIVGCQSCVGSALTIYKLANLIITCSHSHPLLPVICQKFFYLYHSRVPLNRDEQQITDQYGTAQKFYEQNIGLMKKLKGFFIETDSYYNETALKSDDDVLSQFYSSVSKLFKSFTLWLEETRISRVNRVNEFEFPPQFNPNKLAAIFARNETYWTEYVYLPNIRKQQKDAANAWLKSCFRFHPERVVRSASRSIESSDPKENIIRHLQSYDKPLSPPNIPQATSLIQNITYSDLSSEAIAPKLRKAFKNVVDYSKNFNMTIQEMNSLNCGYKDLIPLLYENKPIHTQRTVVCRTSSGCNGSGTVQIKIFAPSINESIRVKISTNRERCSKLVESQLSNIPQDFTRSVVQIRHSIRCLLAMYQTSKYTKQQHQIDNIRNVGLVLFYDIVNGINESVNLCQPSHELCAHALSTLGVLIIEHQNLEGLRLLKTAINRSDLINMFSDLIVPSVTEPQYFLEMYKFIVDSYMRKCDTKILFVLLSKFDIYNWLIQFKPRLCDITELLKLIVKGLECWNRSDSTLIQGLLRRHLMHIFQYDFPEHYGEVLQIVLLRSSDQKLMPSILFDIVNALYHLSNCKLLEPNNSASNREDIHHFASTQKLFSYKDLLDTMLLLSRHFQNERLQHGLHGLYPKHKDYCDNILLLLKSMGHSVIIAAVHAYPGVLGDTLVDWLWPCLCETFSPWLVPYYPQTMENSPANWIKQVMSNNQILLPWSELYIDSAQKVVHAFVDCIQLILDMLPASDTILGHIFHWYESHFGNPAVPKHILSPIHTSLALLPWNRFKPSPVHIKCLYNVVQQFVPECHSFVGHIFLRITWTPWLQFHIHQWDSLTRQTVLSSLLLCFVKLSYEPHVRDSLQLVQLLQESVKYPWQLMDFQGCERVCEWFISSTEPSVILRLPCDYSKVDAEVLNLLQSAADMRPQSETTSPSQQHSLLKRMLYVKTVVRMLRLCGSKYQQLLSTKEGLASYHSAVNDLLNLIENVCQGGNCSESDIVTLVTDIVGSLQSYGEFTSKIFVEAMIIWQSKSQIGSKVLSCTIDAIGSCKMYTNAIFTLLEATLYNYFRTLDSTRNHHNPSWKNVLTRLNYSLPSSTEGKELIQKELFLCLHVYSICKLNFLKDFGDKITFLQTMHRHLESYKIIDQTEAKVAMIWGLIVACGYQLLTVNDNSKGQLLTLGRYMQTISNQSDGWGDGLLGAIGFKKDGFSKKRRILTKCLSCIVFSLFPDVRDDSQLPCKEFVNALEELISTINSKKFSDIRSDGLVAIDIIDGQSKELARTKENVCLLIRLFYKEHYLFSVEDAWNFIC